MSSHIVNLYMHEIAMHIDHNVDDFKPPFTEDSIKASAIPEELTANHIGALSTCLEAINSLFEIFLSLEVDVIRCLPVAHLVRMGYAVVALIKMYFGASRPDSELGKVINKNDMKVEQCLEDLIRLFSAAAAEEKSRPPAKFLMVVIMLKTWFYRWRDIKSGVPASVEIPSTSSIPSPVKIVPAKRPAPPRSEEQMGSHQTTNTRLHMLSEVATSDPSGPRAHSQSGQISYPSPSSGEWMVHGQQAQTLQAPTQIPYGYGNVPMEQLPPQLQHAMYLSGNFDPSHYAGTDFGLAMGDSLDQTMGMALGYGDYGGGVYTSEGLVAAAAAAVASNYPRPPM